MEGQYDVTRDGKSVGVVTLLRRGLYYEVRCHCHTGKEMLHLMMQIKEAAVDLGILIPAGSKMELNTKIATKRIGEGEPAFYLKSRTNGNEHFFPISPELPFPLLDRLGECRLCRRGDHIGVIHREENYGEKNEI